MLPAVGGESHHFAQIHGETGGRTGASKGLAHIVVTTAQRNGIGMTRAIGGEHDPAVIVIAAQIGQVKADRQPSQRSRKGAQISHRSGHLGVALNQLQHLVEHLAAAIAVGQARARQRAPARRPVQSAHSGSTHPWPARRRKATCTWSSSRSARFVNARKMPTWPRSIRVAVRSAWASASGKQADDLDVGLDAGMTVQLGTDLQRLARGRQAVGPRMPARWRNSRGG